MTTLALLGCLLLAPQDSRQAKQPELLPVPRTLVMHRGDKRITIDGNLQDWPSAPPILLDDERQLSGTQLLAWREASDLAARAFMLWDREDLCFAAVVRDDWHRVLGEKAPRLTEIPCADSIVLTFDPERDTRSIGADDGRKEDREFWLGATDGGEQKLVLWDRYRGTARFASGALAIARDQTKGLTTYEARIPWSEILPHGHKAEAGRVCNLQVVVNDFDEITDAMPQTRIGWTFGSFAERIDPGVFGAFMLVEQLAEGMTKLPDFPAPPQQKGDPVPGLAYWIELTGRLAKNPPAVFRDESGDAGQCGGSARRSALEDLEHQLAVFPRVDFVEFQQRIDRRMRRECAGIVATGLPSAWQYQIENVGRELKSPAPAQGARLVRLPQSGFLVRSKTASFTIDAAGNDLEKHLLTQGAPEADFALLTDPNDITRRNDQLLMRLVTAKRRVFTHLAFHLPGVPAAQLDLCVPGTSYDAHGLKIKVLGKQSADGKVSAGVGYLVTWPDGKTLLVGSPWLDDEHLLGTRAPDVLLLSAQHPRAAVIAQRARASLTVLTDVLQCAAFPGPDARVSLAAAHTLQGQVRPNPSLLLAPGESFEIFR